MCRATTYLKKKVQKAQKKISGITEKGYTTRSKNSKKKGKKMFGNPNDGTDSRVYFPTFMVLRTVSR
ncbi:MAG: hypothetical protein GY762_21175 [Proteobacteria bacterium]|nr:hypothetical protein [Pseudomonadota bacterium]